MGEIHNVPVFLGEGPHDHKTETPIGYAVVNEGLGYANIQLTDPVVLEQLGLVWSDSSADIGFMVNAEDKEKTDGETDTAER